MSLSEWEFAFNSNQYNKIVKTKKVISEAYQDDVDGYPNLAESNIKKLFDWTPKQSLVVQSQLPRITR